MRPLSARRPPPRPPAPVDRGHAITSPPTPALPRSLPQLPVLPPAAEQPTFSFPAAILLPVSALTSPLLKAHFQATMASRKKVLLKVGPQPP